MRNFFENKSWRNAASLNTGLKVRIIALMTLGKKKATFF